MLLPLWAKLILLVFATYRTASLVSSEEGPYVPFLYKDTHQTGVFKWLRTQAGAYRYVYAWDAEGNQTIETPTNLGRGIKCPLCTGGYLGLLLTFLIFSENIILNFFLIWLGAWGFQVFLENLTSDDAIKEAIEDVAESVESDAS